ncbi:MAG: hypothetical protein IJP01_04545, partial [Oscillospiraceae bacterium]|nr:hypothetical protein [Oscillospiraceae bacterium]
MDIHVIAQHNDKGYIVFSERFPGAYGRGENRLDALKKLLMDVVRYAAWQGWPLSEDEHMPIKVVEDVETTLAVEDADNDVLFESEKAPLTEAEYAQLKYTALRSAADLTALYESIAAKDATTLPERDTFYGKRPRTAREMFSHVANVNSYYFGCVGVDAENSSELLAARMAGFAALEQQEDFLQNRVFTQEDTGEQWTVRKLLRRFIWHDRIHAKAMWRMANALPEAEGVAD